MSTQSRPLDSGRKDALGRTVRVSGQATTGRADAPPPPDVSDGLPIDELKAAVADPDSDAAVLLEAARSDEAGVRHAAVGHRNADRRVLEQGLADGSVFVRARAAKHPGLGAELWDRAMSDRDAAVRTAAIDNPIVDADRLERALHDDDDGVRGWAVSHRAITEGQLRDVFGREGSTLRAMVMDSPNVSTELLRAGAVDDSDFVRGAARFGLEQRGLDV